MGRGSRSRCGQRVDQHGEGREIGMAWMLLTETTQARLGAPDIATDESGHDLVDEESVAAIEKEVELSPVRGPLRRRWR
jgi:hypothetical protein